MPGRFSYTLGDEKARNRHRAATQPWRKWYHLAEWEKLRDRVLLRDRYTCQMCGLLETDTSKLVGDHKVRHWGSRAKFFDEANVWTLCGHCHNSAKQKLEKYEGFV